MCSYGIPYQKKPAVPGSMWTVDSALQWTVDTTRLLETELNLSLSLRSVTALQKYLNVDVNNSTQQKL